MQRTIETERLLLSSPKLSKVPKLFAFLGNKSVMQYTHFDANIRECRRRIAVHEWRRRRDGFAPWTVRLGKTEQIIGWGGLYNDPFDPDWGIEPAYFSTRPRGVTDMRQNSVAQRSNFLINNSWLIRFPRLLTPTTQRRTRFCSGWVSSISVLSIIWNETSMNENSKRSLPPKIGSLFWLGKGSRRCLGGDTRRRTSEAGGWR